jgi:hypothetical protein
MIARFVVTLLGLAAAGLTAGSLAQVKVNWWQATYTATATSSAVTFSVGPLWSCSSGSNCDQLKFSNSNYGTCTRDTDLQKARFWSIFGLAVLAGSLGLVGGILAALNAKSAAMAGGGLLFFGFIASGISMGLFYQSIEYWLFCNDSYCTWATNNGFAYVSCSTTVLTAPFIMQGVATIILFIGGILGAGIGSQMPSDAAADSPPPTAVTIDAEDQPLSPGVPPPSSTEPQAKSRSNADGTSTEGQDSGKNVNEKQDDPQTEPAAAQAEGEAEADDWVWDEDSGMYWSDTSAMYYDYNSGWYYEPYSAYWYNPETEEWVAAE